MKILKSGKIKLESGDFRLGNFVITEEEGHVKVQDISRTIVFRIGKGIAQGQLLSMMLNEAREGIDKGLKNYVAVMYSVLVCVPDNTFLQEVFTSVSHCLERNKALYSLKDDISDEEDKQIIEEEKERQWAEEEARRVVTETQD